MTALLIGYAVAIVIVFFASRPISINRPRTRSILGFMRRNWSTNMATNILLPLSRAHRERASQCCDAGRRKRRMFVRVTHSGDLVVVNVFLFDTAREITNAKRI